MSAFHKILIANRGEIALRVMRTCREMGIRTVAVYSEADRRALHVAAADEAVPIASYLSIEQIVDAARKTAADAIHPGYGFLAENAAFAEACASHSIVFIGPSPDAIRAMGSKIEGRKLAAAAGVPVIPEGTDEFPLMVKASAGGGGRGMRIVRHAGELAEAVESAQREAEKAFGDGTLLYERYIEGARHVEIQILGDHHGHLIHLYERDCSLQRRHQKIIEECPSPAVDAGLRARMGEAAVSLGRALNYSSAGTVEFLLAPNGEFFFIEVNTRIQVEHPVTEMVTGLDLVRLQIEIAEGARVPAAPPISGHAIEARLYAEGAGTMHVWKPPAGVRCESGIASGSEVGIHYDPMLAKIIAHGPDRRTALRKLIYAIESTVALGVQTNREYLLQLLSDKSFQAGQATTSRLPEFEAQPADPAFAIALEEYRKIVEPARRRILPGVPANYRNSPLPPASHTPEILSCQPGAISLAIDGVARRFQIHETSTHFYIHTSQSSAAIERVIRHPRPESAGQHQTANSPMPGQVLRILVEPGQPVRAGDALVVVEAMKMEQTIRTAIDGIVAAILVKPGEVIAPGQKLVEISAEESHASHAS